MKNMVSRHKQNVLRSIRYRLPATYAIIALLVVLALGLVLYMTLRFYYSAKERAYLEQNAKPISDMLQRMLPSDDQEFLQTQVRFFSFLARARVDILDLGNNLVVSGNTFDQDPFFGDVDNHTRGFFISSNRVEGDMGFDYLLISPTGNDGTITTSVNSPIQIQALDNNAMVFTRNAEGEASEPFRFVGTQGLPVVDVIPAFDFDTSPAKHIRDQYKRSSSVVYASPIYSIEGDLLGTLRLSDGPAYGGQIIDGVMYGWLLASAVSVGLAIVLGWIASRDVIVPLRTLSKTTLKMADGDLTARAVINRQDEFGQLSQSFNEMAQRIEETVSTLRHFLSDAAHEINTPITALRTNLELITPESGIHNVDRALTQVKRLENLTRNLLHLSKLESDIESVSVTLIDARELMNTVAQFHASQAEQAGINLVLDITESYVIVKANAEQMQQALSNLLHNAIKFTETEGDVRISVQAIDQHVHFCIDDTGIGIPTADIPFLFNRFHRGRNATRHEGNGLGLAIVETIVKRYGGSVIAENTSRGARFTVRLPQVNHA